MVVRQDTADLTFFATTERVALARRTHRGVTRTMFIVFAVLAAVILGVGIPLALNGRASMSGIVIVTAVFACFPLIVAASNRKIERDAERFLASDGSTQVRVGSSALVLADTVVPFERITFVYANVEGEQYSNGGVRGEVMAYRMGITDDRPTFGRAIGSAIGTKQRRKLYRDGAKSAVALSIGVDRKSEIEAPAGMINPLKTLPKRGEDPGRIDMPFGAYLDVSEVETLLGAIHRATDGQSFPIGIVAGTMNWATATTGAGETRQKIWEDFPTLFPPQ